MCCKNNSDDGGRLSVPRLSMSAMMFPSVVFGGVDGVEERGVIHHGRHASASPATNAIPALSSVLIPLDRWKPTSVAPSIAIDGDGADEVLKMSILEKSVCVDSVEVGPRSVCRGAKRLR
jgi:hypothetical protein